MLNKMKRTFRYIDGGIWYSRADVSPENLPEGIAEAKARQCAVTVCNWANRDLKETTLDFKDFLLYPELKDLTLNIQSFPVKTILNIDALYELKQLSGFGIVSASMKDTGKFNIDAAKIPSLTRLGLNKYSPNIKNIGQASKLEKLNLTGYQAHDLTEFFALH